MDQSFGNIPPEKMLHFADGFAEAVQHQVQFTSQGRNDKGTLFAELFHKHTSDANCQRVLLAALSEDVRTVLEEEHPTPEKITLLETAESLESIEFDLFQKISNKRIFRDRLYCAGM